MGKKRTGKNTQATYKAEGRYTKNKKAKLERHMKKHPNDDQAKKAISGIKPYSRKAPHNNMVWATGSKLYAEQLSFLGYNGNIAVSK